MLLSRIVRVVQTMPYLQLARVAVSPVGRRRDVVDDIVPIGVSVVLDHAGPRASSWSKDRAVGATDAPDVVTGRKPVPLDDAGWQRITDAYAQAAARIPGAILGIDDDGLLQSTLSPRTGLGVERGLERVLAIHRACAAAGAVDVALTVEELCPGGYDATDGIALARLLVAQGAKRIFASGGTDALAPLRRRVKGSDVRASHHAAHAALASAAWLVGRIDAAVEVIAVIPFTAQGVDDAARALGLKGIVVEAAS